MEGRRHPTAGKINFVLHLDDLRQNLLIYLRNANDILSNHCFPPTDTDNDGDGASESLEVVLGRRSKNIRKSLGAFELELIELGNVLEDLKAMVGAGKRQFKNQD